LSEWIGHLPISGSALEESVKELAHAEPLPAGFDGGTITEWRTALGAGQGGGFWRAPVSAIVQAIEDGLNTVADQTQGDDARQSFDRAEEFNNHGLAKRERGDLDGAARDFTEAIRLCPGVAAPFYNRGLVRRTQGDLEGAIEDFDHAILLDPEPDAFFNRGHARFDNGDLDGAVTDFDEVIRLCPDLADAFNNRAAARRFKGDLVGSLMDYEEAVRLDPENPQFVENRDLTRRELIGQ
jgi:tetratricopeptide (TPR) repeat protein